MEKKDKPWTMVKMDGELFTVPTKFAPRIKASSDTLAALRDLLAEVEEAVGADLIDKSQFSSLTKARRALASAEVK